MPLGRNSLVCMRILTFLGRYSFLLFFLSFAWFGSEAFGPVFASLLPVLMESVAEMRTLKLVRFCAHNSDATPAWDELIRRIQEQLRTWAVQALRMFHQKEIAHFREAVADVVQEVYVRLVQNDCQALQAFKGSTEDEFFGYLKRITHNVALNRARQNAAQKRPRLTHSLDEELENHSDGRAAHFPPKFVAQALAEETHIYELQEHINHYLDVVLRGPQKHRDKMLFQLFYYDGLTIEELAKLPGLNLRPHAIEVAINRVCHRLAKHLKQINS